MSTETETQSSPAPANEPALRSVARVQSIPLVNDTLSSLNSMLLQNTLTAWPYSTAQSISTSTYNIAVPRLSPVLSPIDGLANKGLDFVEQRYPYPFKTPTNDVYNDIQKQREQLYQAADGRFKALAAGADQSIAPIVDLLQAAYDRLNAASPEHPNGNGHAGANVNGESNGAASDKSENQVQRALRLTAGLRNQVVVLSSEQFRQLQQQSAIVGRLTDTLYNLNTLVASSVVAAREQATAVTKDGYARANALAESTRVELDKLNSTLRSAPAHLQQSLAPLQEQIAKTTDALGAVYRSDVPAGEKAGRVLATVRDGVPPVADQVVRLAREGIAGALAFVHHAAGQAPHSEKTSGNGAAATQ